MKDLFVALIAIVAAVAGLAVYFVKGQIIIALNRRPHQSPRSLPHVKRLTLQWVTKSPRKKR
jgi:hypothetical protein